MAPNSLEADVLHVIHGPHHENRNRVPEREMPQVLGPHIPQAHSRHYSQPRSPQQRQATEEAQTWRLIPQTNSLPGSCPLELSNHRLLRKPAETKASEKQEQQGGIA